MTTPHNGRAPHPAWRHAEPATRQPPGRAPAVPRPSLPATQVPPAWGLENRVRRTDRARNGGPGIPGHHDPGLRPVPVRRRIGNPRRRECRSARTSSGARSSAWTRWPGCAPGWSPTRASSFLGQPGVGKSTLIKRQITGAVAAGTGVLVLGDTKPDYTMLTEHLGGQVIRIGRGLDRINPLDAGPLGAALRRMSGPDAQALSWEVRSRRLSLLMALCTLVRGTAITNAEEVILGRAIDLLVERSPWGQPTITDVLDVLGKGPDTVRAAARTDTPAAFQDRAADLIFTLDLLCTGSLAGVFDGPTTRPIDLDAPAVSVDISRVGAAGDKLLTAAMLCTWAYGFGVVDAAAALADQDIAPRRSYMGVMDEAVAGAARRAWPGRVRRQPHQAEPRQGHVERDDHPLPRRPGRAGHRGGPGQGTRVHRAVRDHRHGRPAAPRTRPGARDHAADRAGDGTGHPRCVLDSWRPGARHPGRGKYLIKAGERLGIPVELSLVGAEYALYDTDQAIRAARPRRPG